MQLILYGLLYLPSLKIWFSSRISASSSRKVDADNTTLIMEATTNNYLA